MTTEEKTYNGWTNYETWNVKLWIDNDESTYEYWHDVARGMWEATVDDQQYRSAHARSAVAHRLKAEHEETLQTVMNTVTGCYADLLNAALGDVNWNEIANSLLEDAELEGYEAKERR